MRSRRRAIRSSRRSEVKVARLEKELHKAHTILEVQEKVAGLLGFSLDDGKDS